MCAEPAPNCTSVLGATRVSGSSTAPGKLTLGVLLPVPGTWTLFLQAKVEAMSSPSRTRSRCCDRRRGQAVAGVSRRARILVALAASAVGCVLLPSLAAAHAYLIRTFPSPAASSTPRPPTSR